MGILLIMLAVAVLGWMGLIVLGGAASLAQLATLFGGTPKNASPDAPASKRTRDRVLLVLLAAAIVGHVFRFLGLI